jgi:hypothetical protein
MRYDTALFNEDEKVIPPEAHLYSEGTNNSRIDKNIIEETKRCREESKMDIEEKNVKRVRLPVESRQASRMMK